MSGHIVHCADAVCKVHSLVGGGVDADLEAGADALIGEVGFLARGGLADDSVDRAGATLRVHEAGATEGWEASIERRGDVAFGDSRSMVGGCDLEAV